MTTIYFPTKNLLDYLFSKTPDLEDVSELDFDQIQTFLATLNDKLEPGDNMKHVFFQPSNEVDISDYGYLRFRDRIVFTGTPTAQMVSYVEYKYDSDDITQALRKARLAARAV